MIEAQAKRLTCQGIRISLVGMTIKGLMRRGDLFRPKNRNRSRLTKAVTKIMGALWTIALRKRIRSKEDGAEKIVAAKVTHRMNQWSSSQGKTQTMKEPALTKVRSNQGTKITYQSLMEMKCRLRSHLKTDKNLLKSVMILVLRRRLLLCCQFRERTLTSQRKTTHWMPWMRPNNRKSTWIPRTHCKTRSLRKMTMTISYSTSRSFSINNKRA